MKGVKKRYYGENLSFENMEQMLLWANAPFSIFYMIYQSHQKAL